MVEELCVVGTRAEVPAEIRRRFGDVVQRITCDVPDPTMIAALKQA
jgi:hypothetical protein